MNNFGTIVSHTLSSKIRTKSFVISTVFMMILIIGLTNITTIVDLFTGDDDSPTEVAVVDESEDAGIIAQGLTAPNESEDETTFVLMDGQSLDNVIQEAEEGTYEGVVHLTGSTEDLQASFYGDSTNTAMEVEQQIQRLKEGVLTSELDINEEQLAAVYQPISFEQLSLEEGETVESEEESAASYFTVFAITYIIFFIVILFSTMIATEVATEKSSRVMELLVSSVNPVVQMFGKLTGIALSGVVNLVTLLVAFVIGMTIAGNNVTDFLSSDFIDLTLIGYGLLCVVLGYFIFGGVAAMLGALVSRTEEVNQSVQPLIFLALIGFFIVSFGQNAPDSTFVNVASYIPFFTPQLLILRVGAGSIAPVEIAILIGIMVVSAIIINVLAARIYKGGVLMYGKLSFKKNIKQALAMSKKEK
ncbi:ABC transporter permease [Alkalihalobacillus sp. LMS6]|uniref:ABC transporter permease n=1 Tax=Alkalihalobacillus sp. LMS6 TaxID=2924034 RepID=UPI0020D1E2FE|nr:ABC transporter permease [Alkalihalobacillus sp. LMS6]UTR06314.1 ABC transporter permease [Alkalihalobacillus sp. LMS6]